jgi:IS30 family transposase
MKHKQLAFEQKYAIEHLLKDKHSKKSIISSLGLVESTFYRELKLNCKKRVYNAKHENTLAKSAEKLAITRPFLLLRWKKQ